MQKELQPPELLQPNALNILARGIIANVIRWPILPAEIRIINNATEKANMLLKNHALWLVGTHPTYREGVEFMGRSAQYIHEIFGKAILLPIAQHQYNKNEFILRLAGALTAVTLAPIVNPDSIKTGIAPSEEKTKSYIKLASEAVEKKGVLGIMPQAGRNTSLSLDQSRGVFRLLLAKNKIRKDTKLALTFVSLGPLGNPDYGKLFKRYNLGQKWGITFIATYTLTEMYNLLDTVNNTLQKNPVEEGKFEITFDELGFIILSVGSNRNYTKIDSRYEDLVINSARELGI